MNFDIQVENSLITKYIQPLTEGSFSIDSIFIPDLTIIAVPKGSVPMLI